jgi:hypothetical protein
VTEILDSGRLQALLCGIALCGSASVVAEDEVVPNADFIEYLGLWEESDEDWQLLEADAVAENDERRDPVPEGEESTETEDES